MKPDHPHRLSTFDYTGFYRYHVRVSTWDLVPHFTDPGIVCRVRSPLLLQAERFDMNVIAYCFMPDHVHVLLAGASPCAELRPMISAWKQATGYHVGRALNGRLWQPDYFEQVLREDESSIVVARYILENPIRAGLAARLGEYPFAWCIWQHEAVFLEWSSDC